MTPSRPFIPRPGERSAPAAQFPRSRKRQLQIWWRELDRPLLFMILALMTIGAISVAAASPASARRLSTGQVQLGDLYFFWLHLRFQFLGLLVLLGTSLMPRELVRRGTIAVIDYKTGRSKTADELQRDVQLSIYQMGAREAWGVETSAHSYYFVMTAEKVPVTHSEQELERVKATIEEIGEGISRQDFQPTPSHEICSFCDYRIICPAAER